MHKMAARPSKGGKVKGPKPGKNYDLQKLCRVCLLSTENLSDMETEKSGDLFVNDILNYLVGKECFQDDFPKLICKRCMYHSECTFIFKRKCEKAFRRINRYLLAKNLLSDDEVTTPAIVTHEANEPEDEGIEEYGNFPEHLYPEVSMEEDLNEHVTLADLVEREDGEEGMSHEENETNGYSYIEDLQPEENGTTNVVPSVSIDPKYNYDSVQFVCETCGKNFKSAKYLDRHMHRHLEGSDIVMDENEENEDLADPLRQRKYLDGVNYNMCMKCKQLFVFKSNLDVHLRVHTNRRPHQCQVCKLNFTWRSTLRRHQRTHTGKKPYVCKICDKTFQHQQQYNEHLQYHTSGKHYKCEVCHMTFGWRSNLVRHQAMHAGERRYHCRFCNRAFLQKSNMQKHERIHFSTNSIALS